MNVREWVSALQDAKRRQTSLAEICPEFNARYPKLYGYLAGSDTVDQELLNFILNQYTSRVSNTTSELESDMEVSMKLAHAFLYDDTNRPTDDNVERCKEKIRRLNPV